MVERSATIRDIDAIDFTSEELPEETVNHQQEKQNFIDKTASDWEQFGREISEDLEKELRTLMLYRQNKRGICAQGHQDRKELAAILLAYEKVVIDSEKPTKTRKLIERLGVDTSLLIDDIAGALVTSLYKRTAPPKEREIEVAITDQIDRCEALLSEQLNLPVHEESFTRLQRAVCYLQYLQGHPEVCPMDFTPLELLEIGATYNWDATAIADSITGSADSES